MLQIVKILSPILRLINIVLPGILSISFLLTPLFDIYINRDLQTKGKQITAKIDDFELKPTKSGASKYRIVKFVFEINDKKYSVWQTEAKLKVGEKTKIIYSPIYPWRIILLSDKSSQTPWNKGIIFRLLVMWTFGIITASIAIQAFFTPISKFQEMVIEIQNKNK